MHCATIYSTLVSMVPGWYRHVMTCQLGSGYPNRPLSASGGRGIKRRPGTPRTILSC